MKKFFLFLLLPIALFSTDLSPWFKRELELQTLFEYRYQRYQSVATSKGYFARDAKDNFFHLSLGGAAFDYGLEIETTFAATRKQHGTCDNIRLTGKKRFLNDVDGSDPFSLIVGIIGTQCFEVSLKDISSFHHGKIAGELYVSLGKECPCDIFFDTRVFGVASIGCADVGSPWMRGLITWEKNYWDIHRFKLNVEALMGFGNNNLSRHRSFKGYGPIKHRSVDVGFAYEYLFENQARLELGYQYRVYAKNFPENVNTFIIAIHYPISPVDFYPTRFLINTFGPKGFGS